MSEAQVQPPLEPEITHDSYTEMNLPTEFRLYPFDQSMFTDGELAIARANTASLLKEHLQTFARLDRDIRASRAKRELGLYSWAIFTELQMTSVGADANLLPSDSYMKAFGTAYEKASNPRDTDFSELYDKHENHPALEFIDTVQHISPKSAVFQSELVHLRRTILILLDEYSR